MTSSTSRRWLNLISNCDDPGVNCDRSVACMFSVTWLFSVPLYRLKALRPAEEVDDAPSDGGWQYSEELTTQVDADDGKADCCWCRLLAVPSTAAAIVWPEVKNEANDGTVAAAAAANRAALRSTSGQCAVDVTAAVAILGKAPLNSEASLLPGDVTVVTVLGGSTCPKDDVALYDAGWVGIIRWRWFWCRNPACSTPAELIADPNMTRVHEPVGDKWCQSTELTL